MKRLFSFEIGHPDQEKKFMGNPFYTQWVATPTVFHISDWVDVCGGLMPSFGLQIGSKPATCGSLLL